jgi:hypothetical protein
MRSGLSPSKRSGASVRPQTSRGTCARYAARLTPLSQRGFLNVIVAENGVAIGRRFHDLLFGLRTSAVRMGVASEAMIQDLLARLRVATARPHPSLIGPVYLEIIAKLR